MVGLYDRLKPYPAGDVGDVGKGGGPGDVRPGGTWNHVGRSPEIVEGLPTLQRRFSLGVEAILLSIASVGRRDPQA